MAMMLRRVTLVLIVMVAPTIAVAQAGKVERIAFPAKSDFADSVRAELDPNGYRITLDDGAVWCEIWLLRKVPFAKQPPKDPQGALYSQLAESTFVGAISFLQNVTDYRGQAIPKGSYTLRYELLPNDGNHLGVAPNRDFLLLIPAAADSDPNAMYKFTDLVAMSRKASGSKHPAPLNLGQPDAAVKTPSVAKDDEGHWGFSGHLTLASGEDLPFTLVIKGTAPQ
jgi:hypothetical protein